jgi:hypothetical protein
MDYSHVVGFYCGMLKETSKHKSVKGDLDFLESLIAFILVFLPLRGWALSDKPTRKSMDSLTDFILRGLGIAI